MSDARATDPVDFGLLVQFLPQRTNFARILADQERTVAVHNAINNQSISRQMRVRAGKPIADKTAVGVYRNTRRAPMGELVGAVGNSSACHGSMKNDGLEFGDFHQIKADQGR